MLKQATQDKLQELFCKLPEAALRQLYQAFMFGKAGGNDDLPYDCLIGLAEKAASDRDFELVESLNNKDDDEIEDISEQLSSEIAESAEQKSRFLLQVREKLSGQSNADEKAAEETEQTSIEASIKTPLILEKDDIVEISDQPSSPLSDQKIVSDGSSPSKDETEDEQIIQNAPITQNDLEAIRRVMGAGHHENAAVKEQDEAKAPYDTARRVATDSAQLKNESEPELKQQPSEAAASTPPTQEPIASLSEDTANQSVDADEEDMSDAPVRPEEEDISLNDTENGDPDDSPTEKEFPEYVAPEFVPPRNAMHAFFKPFSAVIIDPPTFKKRVEGYICSTSLPAIWRLINEEESGSVIRETWMQAERLTEPEGEEYYYELTQKMHQAAASQLDALIENAKQNKDDLRSLAIRLGGKAALQDLFEFHNIVNLSKSFQKYYSEILPIIHSGKISDHGQLISALQNASSERAKLASYLQYAILSQLSSPSQGLSIFQALKDKDLDIQDADRNTVAKHFLGVIDGECKGLEKALLTNTLTVEQFSAINALAAFIDEIRLEAKRLKQAAILKRLQPMSKMASEILLKCYRKALHAISVIQPMKAVGDDGMKYPNIQWIEQKQNAEELLANAQQAAHFLQESGKTAKILHGVKVRERAISRASGQLHDYLQNLIRFASEIDAQERNLFDNLLQQVVQIYAIFNGQAAADNILTQASPPPTEDSAAS